MARGRLVSKSLGSSRKFHAALAKGGKLGEFCQVLFPLIIANTDDFGRMAGDAFTVKNVVLPSSKRMERDFDKALDVLADVELIDRYTVDGRIYLQVNDFDAHQPNLHKRNTSKCPESPESPGVSGSYRPNLTEFNVTQSKGIQENPEPRTDVLVDRRSTADLFECFWEIYPKKKAKDDARRAWHKRRPNETLLDLMIQAIQAQLRSEDWQKQGGKFIPHAATWLNGARWTDVIELDATESLSETARHNMRASEEAGKLIEANDLERTGTHGHRR